MQMPSAAGLQGNSRFQWLFLLTSFFFFIFSAMVVVFAVGIAVVQITHFPQEQHTFPSSYSSTSNSSGVDSTFGLAEFNELGPLTHRHLLLHYLRQPHWLCKTRGPRTRWQPWWAWISIGLRVGDHSSDWCMHGSQEPPLSSSGWEIGKKNVTDMPGGWRKTVG